MAISLSAPGSGRLASLRALAGGGGADWPSAIMAPDEDMVRAARYMVKNHGERAIERSEERAERLLLAGQRESAAGWLRIAAAIRRMKGRTP